MVARGCRCPCGSGQQWRRCHGAAPLAPDARFAPEGDE
ncbi:MAG: SEC-C domain-containing protein [Rubrivivax sp.]|nr:SEC-C domain-containing protein [Rubrivivax sp.]